MEVFFGLLAIGVIIIVVFILRSVLRINEMVSNQQKQISELQSINKKLEALLKK